MNVTKQRTSSQFSSILEKYSHYLQRPSNREQLLALGTKLFRSETDDSAVRPSFNLLTSKESELGSIPLKSEPKVKPLVPSKTLHHLKNTAEPTVQPTNNNDTSEDILLMQDKNSLLLARRKALEKQRNDMQTQAGELMEQSIQQKVSLRLQMQKLKAELDEQLSRSRPQAAKTSMDKTPILEELADLNRQILTRITGFKMTQGESTANCERAVLDQYKPHMEQILGKIYAHSEYLPLSDVMEKFNSESETIEHEIREIETQLRSEHERNDQLQKEASQLAEAVQEQKDEVTRLKKQNAQLSREIALLHDIAEQQLTEMKAKHAALLEIGEEDDAVPTSARAVTVTTGNERKMLRKSPSQTLIIPRDSAVPQVSSIDEFIEMNKAALLEKINHAQLQ